MQSHGLFLNYLCNLITGYLRLRRFEVTDPRRYESTPKTRLFFLLSRLKHIHGTHLAYSLLMSVSSLFLIAYFVCYPNHFRSTIFLYFRPLIFVEPSLTFILRPFKWKTSQSLALHGWYFTTSFDFSKIKKTAIFTSGLGLPSMRLWGGE